MAKQYCPSCNYDVQERLHGWLWCYWCGTLWQLHAPDDAKVPGQERKRKGELVNVMSEPAEENER